MAGDGVGNEGKRGRDDGARWKRKISLPGCFHAQIRSKGVGNVRNLWPAIEAPEPNARLELRLHEHSIIQGTAGSKQNGVPWKLDVFTITFPT